MGRTLTSAGLKMQYLILVPVHLFPYGYLPPRKLAPYSNPKSNPGERKNKKSVSNCLTLSVLEQFLIFQ